MFKYVSDLYHIEMVYSHVFIRIRSKESVVLKLLYLNFSTN